ncbi:MAG: aspartate/glutamate racemase family protein [Devosia sp.]|nr:aspartate/glutamate racemase family protein [Devosia sp.]
MRIACLHTAEGNRQVFEQAASELGVEGLELTHAMRPDLLLAAERDGGVTPQIAAETRAVLEGLRGDADAVLLTCSTVGSAVTEDDREASVPMLRVDRALAERAVRDGGRVVVLCATETTVGPTTALFELSARSTGAEVDIRVVPGAWARFRAGDQDGYFSAIAAAADAALAEGAEVVALAQASMAGAAKLARGGEVLASPAIGLAAAVDAARG